MPPELGARGPWGGEDYKKQMPDGLWYHVTVGYPYSKKLHLIRGGVQYFYDFDPSKSPPWVTIHCHATDPNGGAHRLDWFKRLFG
jgi:hypothetical protein